MLSRLEKLTIKAFITNKVIHLCKNKLRRKFDGAFCIEGLIGITIQQDEVLLLSFNEEVKESQTGDLENSTHNTQDLVPSRDTRDRISLKKSRKQSQIKRSRYTENSSSDFEEISTEKNHSRSQNGHDISHIPVLRGSYFHREEAGSGCDETADGADHDDEMTRDDMTNNDLVHENNDESDMEDENGEITDKSGEITVENGEITDENSEITNENGQFTDGNGEITDENGEITDENGQMTDENGEITDENGQMTDGNFESAVDDTENEITEHDQTNPTCAGSDDKSTVHNDASVLNITSSQLFEDSENTEVARSNNNTDHQKEGERQADNTPSKSSKNFSKYRSDHSSRNSSGSEEGLHSEENRSSDGQGSVSSDEDEAYNTPLESVDHTLEFDESAIITSTRENQLSLADNITSTQLPLTLTQLEPSQLSLADNIASTQLPLTLTQLGPSQGDPATSNSSKQPESANSWFREFEQVIDDGSSLKLSDSVRDVLINVGSLVVGSDSGSLHVGSDSGSLVVGSDSGTNGRLSCTSIQDGIHSQNAAQSRTSSSHKEGNIVVVEAVVHHKACDDSLSSISTSSTGDNSDSSEARVRTSHKSKKSGKGQQHNRESISSNSGCEEGIGELGAVGGVAQVEPDPDKPFRCERCGKYFKVKSSLNRHLRSTCPVTTTSNHTAGTSATITAASAGTSTTSATTTTASCLAVAPPSARARAAATPNKVNICSVCDKLFSRRDHLTRHMWTHTGEKPYQCPHCDKGYTDKRGLSNHLKTHRDKNV